MSYFTMCTTVHTLYGANEYSTYGTFIANCHFYVYLDIEALFYLYSYLLAIVIYSYRPSAVMRMSATSEGVPTNAPMPPAVIPIIAFWK